MGHHQCVYFPVIQSDPMHYKGEEKKMMQGAFDFPLMDSSAFREL